MIQDDILPMRTTSAVGVTNDKKNSMIEADKYSYATMDLMVDLDKTFRRSKPMQRLATRVRRVALREKKEEELEELTEKDKQKLARERHFIKLIKKGTYP